MSPNLSPEIIQQINELEVFGGILEHLEDLEFVEIKLITVASRTVEPYNLTFKINDIEYNLKLERKDK